MTRECGASWQSDTREFCGFAMRSGHTCQVTGGTQSDSWAKCGTTCAVKQLPIRVFACRSLATSPDSARSETPFLMKKYRRVSLFPFDCAIASQECSKSVSQLRESADLAACEFSAELSVSVVINRRRDKICSTKHIFEVPNHHILCRQIDMFLLKCLEKKMPGKKGTIFSS